MAEQTWQVSSEAAEIYEAKFVPAIFGEWHLGLPMQWRSNQGSVYLMLRAVRELWLANVRAAARPSLASILTRVC